VSADTERLLGRFDEFQKWEEKQHGSIDKRLDTIEGKVDALALKEAKSSGGKAAWISAISALFAVVSLIVSFFMGVL
jgi:hypothetical protein